MVDELLGMGVAGVLKHFLAAGGVTHQQLEELKTALEALAEGGDTKEVLDDIKTVLDAVKAALESGGDTRNVLDTIDAVLDTIEGRVPSKGQKTKSGSVPVTLASDEDDVKVTLDGETVTIGSSALPTGAATEAKQDTQITAEQAIQASAAAIAAAIATHLGAAPASALLAGFRCVSGVPTEETAGDIAAPWMDLFRRLVIAGFNPSSGKLDVTVGNYPMTPISNAWTALTEAGSTAVIDVSYYTDITIKTVVAAINTSVDWKLEGSMDGTNFFDMKDQDGTAQIQKLSNGTYHRFYSLRNDHANGKYANYVRFTFAAEAGGTDVTLTPTIYARR